MKSKLVKYPFNDGKRYRWDTYKMGKKFEYSWDKQLIGNYETLAPYIKYEDIDDNKFYNNEYAYVDFTQDENAIDWQEYEDGFQLEYDSTDISADYNHSIGIGRQSQYRQDGWYNVKLIPTNNNATSVKMNNLQPITARHQVATISVADSRFTAGDIELMKTHQFDVDKLVQRLAMTNSLYFFSNTYDKYDVSFLPGEGDYISARGEYRFTPSNEYTYSYEYISNVAYPYIAVYAEFVGNFKMDLKFNLDTLATYKEPTAAGEPEQWQDPVYVNWTPELKDIYMVYDDRYCQLGHIEDNRWIVDEPKWLIRPARQQNASDDTSGNDNTVAWVKQQEYRGVIPVRQGEDINIFYIHFHSYNNGTENWGTFFPPGDIATNGRMLQLPLESIKKIGTVPDDGTLTLGEPILVSPLSLNGFTWADDIIPAEQSVYASYRYGHWETGVIEPCLKILEKTNSPHEIGDLWNIQLYNINADNGNPNKQYFYVPLRYGAQVVSQYQSGNGIIPYITSVDAWTTITNFHFWSSIVWSRPVSDYVSLTYPSNYISTFPYLIELADWPGLTNYHAVNSWEITNSTFVLKPEIYLIGDETDASITVGENDQVLQYLPLDKDDNQKALQQMAPCEYEIINAWKVNPDATYFTDNPDFYYWNGFYQIYETAWYKDGNIYIDYWPYWDEDAFIPNVDIAYPAINPAHPEEPFFLIDGNTVYTKLPNSVIEWLVDDYDAMISIPNTISISSKTWLTFNSYTANEWFNGYHLKGNQWNGLGSPYAYINGLYASNESKTLNLLADICPVGKYKNVFTLFGDNSKTISDTLNNTISASPQVFTNNLGEVLNLAVEIIKSNDRHAYPDNQMVWPYHYTLRPELTKFIEYFETTADVLNVELYKNRYTYPHTNTYFNRDTSLYGRVIGTPTSTNEDSIPDASWRKYLGLYLGETIPFLGIEEQNIPESLILGVPAYDKQINTSETLKYGTVAAASLTFTVKLPVAEAMLYNNEYLILYYDFTHLDDWERMGFFYIDSIESIDENTSRITGHDETYRLNKYVDDFLENYTGEVSLGRFYHDLLDYCDCYYDTAEAGWQHYQLNNVYHAIKTTGIEVAHFVAAIAPGFIHTNIDGDIVLEQYQQVNDTIGITDYADLQYTAYNSDLLNKVRITSNNVVIGEDTRNYGENIYFISDNPLISTMDTTTTLNNLADTVLDAYRSIPAYRPAEIQFLVLPKPTIGQIFSITTLGGDTYKVIVMSLSVDASGVKIKSLGTQSYPVEAQSNSQFINIINDIDSVSADVSNLENAQQILGQAINQNAEDIVALDGRLDTAETNISNLTTGLQNKINNDSISQSNNLTTIKINGTTFNNITNKNYVDNAILSSEAKNSVAEANNLVSVKINNNEVNEIAKKGYVDAAVQNAGSVVMKFGTFNYDMYYSTTRHSVSTHVMYIGLSNMSYGIMVPTESVVELTSSANTYIRTLYRVINGVYTYLR